MTGVLWQATWKIQGPRVKEGERSYPFVRMAWICELYVADNLSLPILVEPVAFMHTTKLHSRGKPRSVEPEDVKCLDEP